MARHFLDLAGATTLETESYLLAQRAVAATLLEAMTGRPTRLDRVAIIRRLI